MSTVTDKLTANRSSSADGKPLPTRGRNRGVLLLGALVIVFGGLIGLLAATSGESEPVVVVTSEIPPGQTISASAVESRDVTGVDGAIAYADVDTVIGSTATVGLTPGQVLTDGAFTDQLTPAAGQTVVGVALTSAQLPAEGLAPGDMVRVIGVPAAEEAGGAPQATDLARSAQVLSVTSSESGEASTLVTLVVPDAQANAIAAASATSQAALIKIPAGSTPSTGAAEEAPAEGDE